MPDSSFPDKSELKYYLIPWLPKTYLVELLAFRECGNFILNLITNFDVVKLDRFNFLTVGAHIVQTAESFQLSLRSNMTLILNAVAQLEKSLIAMV